MRVLHVIRDISIATGGPVTALTGLAEAQAKLGHKVTILATDRGNGVCAPAGVQMQTVLSHGGSWGWAPELGGMLKRLVPAADVLHLHMVWDYPVWAASRIAIRNAKPFVIRPCGQLDIWSLSQKRMKKQVYLRLFGTQLRKAAAIHFTTERERDGARYMFGNKPTFIIPNGVKEEAFQDLPDKGALRRRFGHLTNKRIVLFLGRVHPKKQPDVLIDAFARIAKDFVGLHLLFVGPGDADYIASLKARARRLDVASQTTFVGLLSGGALTEAFRASEVFALPSCQENFGNSIVEAMAAACPVVISDGLDLSAEIAQRDAGLIRSPNAEDFAGALRMLLDDQVLRNRLGANGRRLVLERYTWEPIARATINAYSSLMRHPE